MRLLNHTSGFTLVEMMITLAVLAILLSLAVPAFQSTLDRRILLGAVEQMHADFQFAKSEAIKQNTDIFVSFTRNADGTAWCYGMDDTAACDCTATTAPNSCQIDGVNKVFTGNEFRGVKLQNVNFAGATSTKFGNVRGTATAGRVQFASDAGSLRARVSILGRVTTCIPNGGAVSGYSQC